MYGMHPSCDLELLGVRGSQVLGGGLGMSTNTFLDTIYAKV